MASLAVRVADSILAFINEIPAEERPKNKITLYGGDYELLCKGLGRKVKTIKQVKIINGSTNR